VAVALGLAGVRVGGSGGDPTVAEQAAAALDDPDATVVPLASTMDGDPAARYVVDGSDAYVVVDDLAPLDGARTYQLWELGDGGPTSLGVLGSGVEVVAVERATGGGDLAISEEPAGGSASPTGTVVAGGLYDRRSPHRLTSSLR
jgi:anti-sigma-K factor RskA